MKNELREMIEIEFEVLGYDASELAQEILEWAKKEAIECVPAKINTGIIVSGLNNGRECDIWIESHNACREQTLKNIDERFTGKQKIGKEEKCKN